MKNFCLTAILLVLMNHPGKAGDILYKVSDIPAELKENARSVIRYESLEFAVTDINDATLRITSVVTILNKNGLEDAIFEEHYDKYHTVSAIKGRIYDANGELIKRIAAEDIKDYSAISGYSLYEDNRVKYIDPEIRQFPFTVEYSYEIRYDGILNYPGWSPMSDFNVSVEKCILKVQVAKNLELRYRETNMPVKVSISSDEVFNTYLWEVTNQKALRAEPLGPAMLDYFPIVLLAPVEFEIGGYKGRSDTWLNLGDWIYTLNEGRDALPLETVADLNEMVKNCRDEREKICRLYEYMQGRVRYVNLKIGMGGWQPIEASTVHRLAYGDCKALTNYMKALLKAVGINSYYCLVIAGKSATDVITSFPSSQFNHAILCVPLNTDTIWLECTSQLSPCGYLGGFTENRHALLIDKSNSKLVRTNEREMSENLESCTARIRFDETGSGSLSMSTFYSGSSYDDILSTYLADDKDKKDAISERMTFPSFQVLDYKYEENRSQVPSITETININFENYLTSINSKFLMPVNCTNRVTSSPANSRNRKVDVVIRHPFIEIDTLIYEIPADFKIESLPAPADISSDFGVYKSNTFQQENKIIYIRSFQISQGVHPASTYPDLIDFFDRIVMADDEKCVFIKIQ